MLILAIIIAAVLRFAYLGSWPPGLYRDEATNGLDALNVLAGQFSLYFSANNGREPFYIYLVALAVALFGRSALAVRLPAAVVGVMTTLPVYLLGRDWFGRLVAVLAAFIWAITFWPVHLSRIGLRAILLAPLLALAFWLGTLAYRRGQASWWLLAGLIYGLTFYTYLAARFTPLLLVFIALYLVLTGHHRQLWASGRSLWFLAGATLTLAPLALLTLREPALILGRTSQVSLFNSAVSGGHFWSALGQQIAAAGGMFLWRGDPILRHNALLNYDIVLLADNPAGRPIFDPLLVIPFLIGLGWCLWNWRRPPAAVLLLWQIVMLGPTILAEGAPHFLRAAGILPGVVFLPAIGLSLIWKWSRLPVWLRRGAVILLLVGSTFLTARDYVTYNRHPDVAYLFETAASDLAESARSDAEFSAVFVDSRFWEGWPSVPFLLGNSAVRPFGLSNPLSPIEEQTAVYAWPYASLDSVAGAVRPPAVVTIEEGSLARGDLEPEAYPLYTRYAVQPGEIITSPASNFDNLFLLREPQVKTGENGRLLVELAWERSEDNHTVGGALPARFVHVLGPEGIEAQYDGPLVENLWPVESWPDGLGLRETLELTLPEPLKDGRHTIVVGLYWPDTLERLSVERQNRQHENGLATDDKVTIWPDNQ